MCATAMPQSGGLEGRTAYRSGPGGLLRGLMLDVVAPWFRWFDRQGGQQPDLVLANSRHTAKRIQTAWDRDAAVVYPPVRTHFFTPDASLRDTSCCGLGRSSQPNGLIE